jgi:hypothetical protein
MDHNIRLNLATTAALVVGAGASTAAELSQFSGIKV